MFDPAWLEGIEVVGLTAGALRTGKNWSRTPSKRLRDYRTITVATLDGVEENVHFKLPPELADIPRPEAAQKDWAPEVA